MCVRSFKNLFFQMCRCPLEEGFEERQAAIPSMQNISQLCVVRQEGEHLYADATDAVGGGSLGDAYIATCIHLS